MSTPADPTDDRAADRLAALRQEYGDTGIEPEDLPGHPVAAVRRWLDEAVEAGLHEPNAVVVASVGADGRPAARTVLLKGLDDAGFVFYTNYASRKGRELEASGRAALLFPWHDLQRQVRVEGAVTRVDPAESAAYFAQRPRGSQLGAWASPQSDVVGSRSELDQRYAEVEARFAGVDVPVPPHWGGYRVTPETVELWQGRSGRMHDRLVYRPAEAGEGWVVERLAP